MLKTVEIATTKYVFGAGAVCVLYAKVGYAKQDGTVTESAGEISGIFEACTLDLPPREDKDGFSYVYVWCCVNQIKFDDFDDVDFWVVLKVPPNGYIELPNYCGDVISRVNVSS